MSDMPMDPRSFLAEIDTLRRRVAELEAAEQGFEKAFLANLDACYLVRCSDVKLVDCSDQFSVLFGYLRAEVLGKTIAEVCLYANPCDRERVLELLEERGMVKDLELRGRRKNGDTFDASLSARLLQLPDGAHILGMVRDVTEQRRTRAALEESTAQILAVGNNLPSAMLYQVVGPKAGARQFTYVSDGVTALFGCTPAAALADASHVYDRFEDEDRDRLTAAAERAFQLRTPLVFEARIRTPAGEPRWISLRSSPRQRADGAMVWDGIALDITEQKRAYEAMTRGEQKYRSLVDMTGTGFVILDTEGRVVDANDEYVRLTGRERDEILGRPVIEWTAVAAREAAARAVQQCVEQGFIRGFETSHVDRQGGIVAIEVNANLLHTAAGDQILTLCRDITARKRVEGELLRRETTLKQAGQMAHLGAWEVELVGSEDLRPQTITWSDEVFRIFGYAPGSERPTVQRFYDHVHPEDLARLNQAEAEAIAAKRPYSVEHRIVRTDGTVRVVQEHAELQFDERGQLARMIGAVQDVTERKRVEDELRDAQSFVQAIFDAVPFLLYLYDAEGRLVRWNKQHERLGYSAEELGRMTILDLFPRDPERSAVVQAFRDGIEKGFASVEANVATKDGRLVPYHCAGVAFERAGKRYVSGIGIDLTEIKRTEAALRDANEKLVEQDRRKSEFLAMLSHELRNPLAPICNSLYILGRAAPGGEQARRAQTVIERQIEHMTRLVDDLLDVTRITRGKIQLRRERTELNELARRTVEDHRSVFATSGVQLELLPAGADVWVYGDRNRLTQAISNLLQNSAKFTPAGGRTTVSVDVDAASARAILAVRDTGSGIAPQLLPRLFEAFSQADTTLDRSKGGLGLGLSLVKGLVEMHGGTVSAASEGVGKGALFTIHLPLETTGAETIADRHSHGAGSLRRILIIEDNVDAADSLREALELGGHIVVVAYDGPGGIEKARALRPDVVLCDIGLPGMDGHAVARAMRADQELSRVMLVALTGYAGPEDVAKAREAGFDAHLAKPPNMEALERVLRASTSPRQ